MNISKSELYIIEFTNEVSIPSGNIVTISPSGYTVKNTTSFVPQCSAKIKSAYTEGSQTLVKMEIKDINYNILKTQYKRVVCSIKSDKPCFIPSGPRQTEYITLQRKNNWEYRYNGYIIAKFIPLSFTENISIKLERKNITQLPSRGQTDQFRIVMAVDKLKSYNISADQVKQVLGGNAAYILDNNNYIFVVDSLGRTIQQINNLIVGNVSSSNNGNNSNTNIIIANIGSVNYNTAKPSPIPTISILELSDKTLLGQLIVSPDTYKLNDVIIVNYNNISYTSNIKSPLLLLDN
jgi:hypothetical protein